MRVIWAVVVDLWRFVFKLPVASQPVLPSSALTLLAPRTQPILVKAAPRPLLLKADATAAVASGEGQAQATNKPNTALYIEPVQGFDSVLATVPYASQFKVVTRHGRWFQVEGEMQRAWLLADDLSALDLLLPKLKVGKVYDDPGQAEVERLRLCIADDFQGGLAGLPLQGVEYVTYALWRRGITIAWPVKHSRTPGTWQHKLRGQPGVHIDVRPRTGSLLEYIIDDFGYLGYVSQVSPDGSLFLEGVGLTHEGQYTESLLTTAHWQALRPVFININ